jgi:hypothetical protein
LADLAAGPGSTPLLNVGRIQSTIDIVPGASCLTVAAASTVGAIDIAGIVHISSLASQAGTKTDGKTSQQAGDLHVGRVTVRGMDAFIDAQGIHVLGRDAPLRGITPQQMQTILNNTLGQDGISVRMLEPTSTSNGSEGKANSGALTITFNHAVYVPYIPGEPNIPIPGLGNQALPSGLYNAVTTVTLGSSIVAANAAGVPSFGGLPGVGSVVPPALSGTETHPAVGVGSAIGPPIPSAAAPSVAPPNVGTRILRAFVAGATVPVGWLILGLLLCAMVSYQMLLGAWSQLLKGRDEA